MARRDCSHHWRAIDRDNPSQASVPAEPGSVFPGVFNVPTSIEACKNHLDAGDHA